MATLLHTGLINQEMCSINPHFLDIVEANLVQLTFAWEPGWTQELVDRKIETCDACIDALRNSHVEAGVDDLPWPPQR